VSKNDNCHCADTTKVKSHGSERVKRKALRRLRKTDIEGVDVKCWGRLFQVQATATGKARSPTVDSRVRRTFSDSEEDERRRLRVPKSAEAGPTNPYNPVAGAPLDTTERSEIGRSIHDYTSFLVGYLRAPQNKPSLGTADILVPVGELITDVLLFITKTHNEMHQTAY